MAWFCALRQPSAGICHGIVIPQIPCLLWINARHPVFTIPKIFPSSPADDDAKNNENVGQAHFHTLHDLLPTSQYHFYCQIIHPVCTVIVIIFSPLLSLSVVSLHFHFNSMPPRSGYFNVLESFAPVTYEKVNHVYESAMASLFLYKHGKPAIDQSL